MQEATFIGKTEVGQHDHGCWFGPWADFMPRCKVVAPWPIKTMPVPIVPAVLATASDEPGQDGSGADGAGDDHGDVSDHGGSGADGTNSGDCDDFVHSDAGAGDADKSGADACYCVRDAVYCQWRKSKACMSSGRGAPHCRRRRLGTDTGPKADLQVSGTPAVVVFTLWGLRQTPCTLCTITGLHFTSTRFNLHKFSFPHRLDFCTVVARATVMGHGVAAVLQLLLFRAGTPMAVPTMTMLTARLWRHGWQPTRRHRQW